MGLNTSHVSLRDILEIENGEAILQFRCSETGYLVWPLIRNTFIRYIMSDLLYETPLISEKSFPRPWSAYSSLFKAYAHNVLLGKTYKGAILLSASGSHVVHDGRYFNRLSDYFAESAFDQSVTLESMSIDWHWPCPRYNKKVIFDAPELVLSSLYGKYNKSKIHDKTARDLVEYVAQKSSNLVGWLPSEEKRELIISNLAKYIATIPMKKLQYKRLFHETGTRIFIREDSSYGGDSSIMNTIARDLGIITVEYQHGAISSGHDAYNFAKVIRNSEDYKRTLPQYYLSYGKWWGDQISMPSEKIVIGNPYRSEMLKNSFDWTCKKKDFVILGDGVETEKYLSLCATLAKELSVSYRIVFRPHPLEIDYVYKIYSRTTLDYTIEWDKNIYKAFETADTVISELSTGLFEAVGLVKRIFMWDTPKTKFCYPIPPFSVFSDAEDLVIKIKNDKNGFIESSFAEAFWASNWNKSYLDFLERVYPNIV